MLLKMSQNEIDGGVVAWVWETKWCDICKSNTCDANFLIIEDNKKSFAIEQWKLCNWTMLIVQL
jgi:recombinational DNA repair protein RecR